MLAFSVVSYCLREILKARESHADYASRNDGESYDGEDLEAVAMQEEHPTRTVLPSTSLSKQII